MQVSNAAGFERELPGVWIKNGETTPEMVLQMRDSLLQLAMSRPGLLHQRAIWDLCDEKRAAIVVRSIPAWLPQADCVLWEGPYWDAGLRGHSAFAGHALAAAQLPARPAMYFVRGQVGAGTQQSLSVPGNAECNAVLIERVYGMKPDGQWSGRQGMSVALVYWPVFDTLDGLDPRQDGTPYIRWFPALYEADKVPDAIYPAYLALMSFLKQPFVSDEPTRPFSRQQCRAYERRHGRAPEVRVVALRRRQPTPSSATGGPRTWSCQWLVGGHWRRRSEKWTRGEGPIYVSPHVKGPSDKEFRAPRAVVYDVRR